jgi:transcriptional regulator with XRE-family HTH domain
MNSETLTLSPKLLAFWVRTLRTTHEWSQDALAAASGLNIRTVQRVENGEASNAVTRKCLARGLGYDDHDIFDDPAFAETVRKIIGAVQEDNEKAARETFKTQFPHQVLVKVKPVSGGPELARFIDEANATLLHCADGVPPPAQKIVAGMFDLADVWSDISFSERLSYADELGYQQKEIEGFDLRLYSALRNTTVVGASWSDKSPHPVTIGYLTVVPKDQQIDQIIVPQKLS